GTLDPVAAPRRGDPPRTGRPGARAAGGGGGRASRAGAHHPPGRGGRTGLGRGSAGAGGGSARGGCPRAGSPPGPGDAHWTGAAAAATGRDRVGTGGVRSEEHTSELQSRENLVCRLLLEKKKTTLVC